MSVTVTLSVTKVSLAALAVVWVCLAHSAAADEVYDRIYTTLSDAKFCARVLHKTGTIGCATSSPLTGVLRYAPTVEVLNHLAASPPSEHVGLLMPGELFNKANVDTLLASKLSVAGLIVMADDAPSGGQSPADKNPQAAIRGVSPSSSFEWNPAGSSLNDMSFTFGIVHIDAAESAVVLQRAQENEDRLRDGSFAHHAVQFDYAMSASGNSIDCLKRRTCLPLGGYSVWGSLHAVKNDSRATIMATAQLDANAFFHEMAYGADQSVSGTVALLAAATALSKVPSFASAAATPKRLVFAFFTGEQYAYVGSRRFVSELRAFTCDRSASDGTCRQPYRPDLTFRDLRLSSIDAVLELNQVGLNGTDVFAHTTKPANAKSLALKQTLQHVAASLSDTSVQDAAASTPGLPPSSMTSFVAADSSIPGVVLTDHAGAFKNQFYSSRYDAQVDTATVCKAATLTARTLYNLTMDAQGKASVQNGISADCVLVSKLIECLTKDFGCATVRALLPAAASPSGPLSHYTSVYLIRDHSTVTGLSAFVKAYLSSLSSNSSVHYHAAVDPDIDFDTTSQTWLVNNASSASPLWTESFWGKGVRTRLFKRDKPVVEVLLMVFGVLSVGFTYLAVRVLRSYCHNKFKVV